MEQQQAHPQQGYGGTLGLAAVRFVDSAEPCLTFFALWMLFNFTLLPGDTVRLPFYATTTHSLPALRLFWIAVWGLLFLGHVAAIVSAWRALRSGVLAVAAVVWFAFGMLVIQGPHSFTDGPNFFLSATAAIGCWRVWFMRTVVRGADAG